MGVLTKCAWFGAILVVVLSVVLFQVVENTESPTWHLLLSLPFVNAVFRSRQFAISDIPDLTGKVAVVTGGYTGIGLETVRALAEKGATVVVAGRNASKGEEAIARLRKESNIKELNIEFMELDLDSLKSVRQFVKQYKERDLALHMLINNAGVMMCPFGLTEEGVERQFGSNHLSHFLLTQELLPVIERSAPSRIVLVSSAAHLNTDPDRPIRLSLGEINDESSYDPMKAYAQSKLANILYANELARRLGDKKVYVNSAHPGAVSTEVGRHVLDSVAKGLGTRMADLVNWLFINAQYTPLDGALTQLFLATSPKVETEKIRGRYYVAIATDSLTGSQGRNATLARLLWDFSEELVQQLAPPASP